MGRIEYNGELGARFKVRLVRLLFTGIYSV